MVDGRTGRLLYGSAESNSIISFHARLSLLLRVLLCEVPGNNLTVNRKQTFWEDYGQESVKRYASTCDRAVGCSVSPARTMLTKAYGGKYKTTAMSFLSVASPVSFAPASLGVCTGCYFAMDLVLIWFGTCLG